MAKTFKTRIQLCNSLGAQRSTPVSFTSILVTIRSHIGILDFVQATYATYFRSSISEYLDCDLYADLMTLLSQLIIYQT